MLYKRKTFAIKRMILSIREYEVFQKMAYIRKGEELLTGCQESRDWSPEIDLQVDFVMVYGIDGGMPERIRAYREKGYVVHVMAGSAWGP